MVSTTKELIWDLSQNNLNHPSYGRDRSGDTRMAYQVNLMIEVIDALVYELYGLTEEDIRIVEGP